VLCPRNQRSSKNILENQYKHKKKKKKPYQNKMIEKQNIKNLTHAAYRESPEIKGFNPFIACGFWFLNASSSDNFRTMSSSSG